MAVNVSDPTQLRGMQVSGRSGEKLGKVSDVYLDNETGNAEWAAVSSGLFGSHVTLVPLATADLEDGGLHVPFDKQQLQNAPHHDPDRELSTEDEKQLFEHYGVSYGGETVTAQPDGGQSGGGRGEADERSQETANERAYEQARERALAEDRGTGTRQGGEADQGRAATQGHDVSGPTTDDAMTRSEEHLQAGTQRVETGKARLRKYVVSEQQTVTVPVSHEEVRLEREPITEANRGSATDGPTISEEEHEVTLHAEQPVVTKEAVPVERVRLGTETVQEQQQVSDEVRKEQIEVDDPQGRPQR